MQATLQHDAHTQQSHLAFDFDGGVGLGELLLHAGDDQLHVLPHTPQPEQRQ